MSAAESEVCEKEFAKKQNVTADIEKFCVGDDVVVVKDGKFRVVQFVMLR